LQTNRRRSQGMDFREQQKGRRRGLDVFASAKSGTDSQKN
jgi:hypothetical protein